MTSPHRPGLQQERTMLAWRRSTLSFFVVALLVSRVAVEASASAIVVLTLVAAAFSAWLTLMSLRGGRWSGPSIVEPEFELLLRDGRLPALVAVVASLLCLVVAAIGLGWTI